MKTMPRRPKNARSSELYLFCTRKGWTQEEMAKELGVSRATLQRLETLTVLPPLYQHAFNDVQKNAR